jgi:hypothetical protein
MAAAFAAAVPVYDRRSTADWAQDNERRAAAQRAEQQRHAEFLARMSKEQEDRENAEALESFMEQQSRLVTDGQAIDKERSVKPQAKNISVKPQAKAVCSYFSSVCLLPAIWLVSLLRLGGLC